MRHLLEGSVRKAGNRVRITGQLIEAKTGAHLWADRFDGLFEDVFDLQDKVASSVAGVIEPALQAAEIRRSAERPTSDLTAYDLYLRALSLYEKGRAGVQEALELLGRAIERDPDYGPALALAAHCHQVLDIIGWSNDPATNRNEGIDLARVLASREAVILDLSGLEHKDALLIGQSYISLLFHEALQRPPRIWKMLDSR